MALGWPPGSLALPGPLFTPSMPLLSIVLAFWSLRMPCLDGEATIQTPVSRLSSPCLALSMA